MSVIEYKKGSTDASATASYYGGALPVDADTLRFSEGAGLFNVQTTTAIAGVTLAAMAVSDGCAVQIGDADNPLRVDITDLQIFGRGPAYYLQGGTDAGVLTTCLFDPANGSAKLNLYSLANTTLRVFGGIVTAPSSVSVNVVEVDGPGVVILQEHASDTLEGTSRVCNGGVLICRRRIAGTITVGEGGTLEYDVDTTTTTSQSIQLLGGKLIVKKGSVIVNECKGEYDLTKLEKTGYTHTITERKGVTERVGGLEPTYSRTTIRPAKKISQ